MSDESDDQISCLQYLQAVRARTRKGERILAQPRKSY